MATTTEQALALVGELEKELRCRREDVDWLTAYYDGCHKLHYASSEYREWFADRYDGFSDNWCRTVADATTERLEVTGIRPFGADKPHEALWRAWEESDAPAESSMAFSRAAYARRSFALVWGEDAEVTFEDPRQAIVGYEPGSRRKRRAALKIWRASDTLEYATLYTKDAVWKFQRAAAGEFTRKLELPDSFLGNGGWVRREDLGEDSTWPLPNPMDEVPMVELQHRPRMVGRPISEIEGVIPMQNAINTLWSYLFSAGDFAALPQRIILGAQLPKVPILNDEGIPIGERPIDLPDANVKRILNLEGPDAKVAQWDAAKLDTFTDVIEKCASHIANQTRTPMYYFASSIENVSGDTLKMLETGLVSKISEIKRFEHRPVREIFRLMALAKGDESLAKSVAGGTVLWANHEARSDAQLADAMSKYAQLGMPFEWIAEQVVRGDADELDRIMEMRKRDMEVSPLALLAQAERMMPGGAGGPGAGAGGGASKNASGGQGAGGRGGGSSVAAAKR